MALDPLSTLYERDPAPAASLPPRLATAYGGGLLIEQASLAADAPPARPYVIANFVETVDGVVSYAAKGQSGSQSAGGGAISGASEPDHMVMGLLRAHADAVIFGSGSLREDAGHVRIPAFVYPPFAGAYAELRRQLGKASPLPLNVVVSASGDLPLDEPTFHTTDLHVVIATTPAGAARLATRALPPGVEARVILPAEPMPADVSAGAPGVDPLATLDLLAREYGVRLALHEGGPRLLASYLAAGALDELFLTFAPQFAGRATKAQRPALLEGVAFTPANAPWAALLGVKRAADHLLLRYHL